MFWEKILTLCAEKNISPNALCAIIGLSNATATKWKNGSVPHAVTLRKIANYFNVSTDYLLGKTDIKNPLPKTEEQIVYSFEGEGSSKQPFDKSKLLSLAELNEAASNLSVEQIKRITDFIKDMNKN